MRCALVTGAAGFIGGATVERFVAEGWHVLALVHRRSSPQLERFAAGGAVDLLRGDAADPATFRSQLDHALRKRNLRLDAVVHAAGRASDVGWAREFRRSHVETATAMAGLVADLGVDRMVLVSSTDVYGLRDFNGEGEDELPLDPRPWNPYPRFKIAAEKALAAALPADRWVIVRPAAVWGRGDRTLGPRIAGFLKTSPWIVHFGSWRGRNRWPLAHVRNVALTLFLAATAAPPGIAVNCLDDERTTMEEFYRLMAGIYCPGKRFRSVCLPFAAGHVFGSTVSGISTLLNLDRPFADPSLYALHSVSHNLDFSNQRMKDLFAPAGRTCVTRDEGLGELKDD